MNALDGEGEAFPKLGAPSPGKGEKRRQKATRKKKGG